MTTVATVPNFTEPAPSRLMEPAVFSAAVGVMAAELTLFTPAMNVTVGGINAVAGEVNVAAAEVEADRVLANTAKNDAVLAVNTPTWLAATNWATGITVRSPTDLQLYTRKTPGGVQATDPATDAASGSGTYWTRTPVATTVSPQVVSAAKTFALADANVPQLHPGTDATARIWTIPANASVPYPVGTIIPLINAFGAGVLTIAITTDTLRWAGTASTGTRTLAANGNACLVKVATTEWQIVGTGVA